MEAIKQNDNKRKIIDQLLFGGVPQNLTGATVNFVMRSQTRIDEGDYVSIKQAATITNVTQGRVEFQLLAAHTAIAGKYYIEWEVTFADASVTTFPSEFYGELDIVHDLG